MGGVVGECYASAESWHGEYVVVCSYGDGEYVEHGDDYDPVEWSEFELDYE